MTDFLRGRTARIVLIGAIAVATGVGAFVVVRAGSGNPGSGGPGSNAARPSVAPVPTPTPIPTPALLRLATTRADFDLTASALVGSDVVATVEVNGALDSDGNRWYTVYTSGQTTPVGSAAWLGTIHVVKVGSWKAGPVLSDEPVIDLAPYLAATSGNASLAADGLHCTAGRGAVDAALFTPLLGKTTVPAGTTYGFIVTPGSAGACTVSLGAQYRAPSGVSMSWTRELVLSPDSGAKPPIEAVTAAGFAGFAAGH